MTPNRRQEIIDDLQGEVNKDFYYDNPIAAVEDILYYRDVIRECLELENTETTKQE